MDETLRIVHHLYGEDTDPADLRRLLEDEALRQEYEALSEVKFHLDHRKRARPDAQVIDRIVAAAATPQHRATPHQRHDRAARPGRATRRFRAIGAVSAVLAVVLAVGIGLDQFQSFIPGASQTDAAMEAPAAVEDAEALEIHALTMQAPAAAEDAEALESHALRMEAPAAAEDAKALEIQAFPEEAPALAGARQPELLRLEESRAVQPNTPALAERAKREDAFLDDARDEITVPSWDETDELLRVHRRIEMIRARSLDLTWDEAAVISLDSLPTEPNAAAGLEAASTRRRDNQ